MILTCGQVWGPWESGRWVYVLFPVHNHIFCLLPAALPGVCVRAMCMLPNLSILRHRRSPNTASSQIGLWSFYSLNFQSHATLLLFKNDTSFNEKCFSNWVLWRVFVFCHVLISVVENWEILHITWFLPISPGFAPVPKPQLLKSYFIIIILFTYYIFFNGVEIHVVQK